MDGKRAGLLVLCLGVGVAFWDQPWLWPLKLLAVMVHETSHALATWIVGGRVQRIVVSADQAGSCLSALPSGVLRQIAVYSAGYVGNAAVGAFLLVATLRFGWGRAVLWGLAAWLALTAMGFAGNAFTLVFCGATALALAVLARWLPDRLAFGAALFIASFVGLYALFDLRDDLWDGAVRGRSDAGLLAGLTWIPALVWAVVWSASSVAVLAFFAWRALARRAGPI